MANAADFLLATGRDEDVALLDAQHRQTYGELRRAAGILAAELAALELPPGSRIGIMGANSAFWVAAYLATIKANLVAVPFSTVLTPAEVTRNASWAGVRAVLLDRRQQRRFLPALPAGTAIITDAALDSDTEPVWPAGTTTDPDDDAVLLFTSGTTSRPKAVRLTHRNIQANTTSIVEYLGLQRDDRMLVILPFYYCYGTSLLHTHLRVGGSLALCNTFTYPETAVEMIEREQCTGFAGVPSSIQLLLRVSTMAKKPLPSLRHIQQAGGKLPPAQIRELVAAQPQAQVFIMYGQTEATARLSYLPPELVLDKIGSIGRGIPGVELQVLDDAGRPVAPGQTGEIVARGENVSPGYFGDPEGTAEKFPGGLLRTGDLATVDEDGFIYVVDRKDDFIKSWGYRISSQEVEACALHLPDLVSAAVVGVPDSRAGESVTLFATLRPGSTTTPASIVEFMRTQLAPHMVPETVHIVDSLPLNSSGKVVKAELRSRAIAMSG